MNERISVKDRLPKSRQIVLMYIKSKEKNTEDAYAIGFLNSVSFKWHTANLYADIDDCREEVTHWMPLPQKPESEDDAE